MYIIQNGGDRNSVSRDRSFLQIFVISRAAADNLTILHMVALFLSCCKRMDSVEDALGQPGFFSYFCILLEGSFSQVVRR